MSFTYDDTGIRTSKTVNGVTHTYQLNGSQIISEQWEDKLLVYLYDATGSPIGMMYRTTLNELDDWSVFWYEKNLQGDIVAVYGSAGLKLVTYTYDAWGNQTVTYYNGGGDIATQYNPFRYRGYYYDTDLGMYYLQSRYYDAKICRFINTDGYVSTGQGVLGNNMFAYCNNSPISYIDPSGESLITAALILLAGAIVGGVLGGVVVAASAAVEEKEVSPVEIVKGVAVGTAIGVTGAGYGLVIATAPSIITYGASKALLWEVASVQVAALGMLAANVMPMILLPLLGLEGEAIEYGEPYNTQQPIFK